MGTISSGHAPGFSVGLDIPYEHWAFVGHGFLNDRDFRNHCVDVHQNVNIYNNTTIINNVNYTKNKTVYAKGPELKEVQRYSGQKINAVTIREHQQPKPSEINYAKNEMKVYKPSVRLQQEQEVIKPKQVMQ